MRGYRIRTRLLFVLPFLLAACRSQKLEYFALNIIVSEHLEFKEGRLDGGLRSLFNYYKDESYPGQVFVPEIVIVRADFTPERTASFAVPLSDLNKWRKSFFKSLPAANLMEDYDEHIPKLTKPEIMTL